MAICLTHTDREATTKCATCFKPLCAECAKSVNGNDFCSDKCSGNFAASEVRFADVKARDKANAGRALVKRITMFIVIIIIIAAAFFFLKSRPDVARKLKQKAGVVKDTAQQGARDLGNRLDQ